MRAVPRIIPRVNLHPAGVVRSVQSHSAGAVRWHLKDRYALAKQIIIRSGKGSAGADFDEQTINFKRHRERPCSECLQIFDQCAAISG